MAEPIKIPPVKREATSTQTIEYLIYFIFGALEILLGFRILFKLLGANTLSIFVSLVYSATAIFIMPFEGIFRRGFNEGIETASVLEPSAIVALIVYAILAMGIAKLIRIASGEQQES